MTVFDAEDLADELKQIGEQLQSERAEMRRRGAVDTARIDSIIKQIESLSERCEAFEDWLPGDDDSEKPDSKLLR